MESAQISLVCPIDKKELDSNLTCPLGHKYTVDENGIYDFLLGQKITDPVEKVAGLYEDLWAPAGFLFTARRPYSRMMEKIGMYVSSLRVLDVGTGPGKLFDYMRCELCVGLDVSSKFLRILRQKRGKRIIPVLSNAEVGLPFPDSFFTGVSSSLTLHMMGNKVKVVQEVSRVLKSEGKVGISVLADTGSIFSKILGKVWKIDLLKPSDYTTMLENNSIKVQETEEWGPWLIILGKKTG